MPDEETRDLCLEDGEFGLDWDHRYYPPAKDSSEVDGEWELTIRGDRSTVLEVHNLLINNGFWIDETGEYEVYERKHA